jgi:hypothetical protein
MLQYMKVDMLQWPVRLFSASQQYFSLAENKRLKVLLADLL